MATPLFPDRGLPGGGPVTTEGEFLLPTGISGGPSGRVTDFTEVNLLDLIRQVQEEAAAADAAAAGPTGGVSITGAPLSPGVAPSLPTDPGDVAGLFGPNVLRQFQFMNLQQPQLPVPGTMDRPTIPLLEGSKLGRPLRIPDTTPRAPRPPGEPREPRPPSERPRDRRREEEPVEVEEEEEDQQRRPRRRERREA